MFSSIADVVLGIVLAVLGVLFLVVPHEKLQNVLPNIKSPKTVKVCGVIVMLCGIVMIILAVTGILA